MPIEDMQGFFQARVDGYDRHMLENIDGMAEAYQCVADFLPKDTQKLLDLGCGTGLELAPVFARFPVASVVGIDLTQAMLDALKAKYAGKDIRLICGSYFDVDFGIQQYDAVISAESLHHFTHAEKLGLYRRVHAAIKPGGTYIEADYMLETQAQEDALFAERTRLLKEQNAGEGFWHFDTPLTVENQTGLLLAAGFDDVAAVWQRGNTTILVCRKG